MKKVLIALGLGMFVCTANAALVSVLNGQAVYDEDRDISWIADANLAVTMSFGVAGIGSGVMNWDTANEWIGAMNATGYLGFSDWRLPITVQPDASCAQQNFVSASFPLQGFGSDCTASEMGHLYYEEGVTSATPGLFSNVQSDFSYWSGTEFASSTDAAWSFGFLSGFLGGFQGTNNNADFIRAWAVRSGDVRAVPVPAAAWLFGSGLIGLLGLARRKRG